MNNILILTDSRRLILQANACHSEKKTQYSLFLRPVEPLTGPQMRRWTMGPYPFAWMEGELRLTTTSAPSGDHCTRPARCGRCPGSRQKAIGALERPQLVILASIELHLSLSLYAPRRSPPACARSLATQSTQYGRRTRVLRPAGPPWGCGSCGKWALARGKATLARSVDSAADESGIEMESVYGHCSLNQPS